MTTLPTVKAGATGIGSRYLAPISRPSGPRPSRARPASATRIPAAAAGYALIGASDAFGLFKSTAGRLGISDPGAAGRQLEDPAVGEGLADGLGGGGAIELLGGCDRPGRQVGHVRAGEVERALQDDRVGLDVAECLADVPQRP